jgi:hypothetical protein
MGGEEGRRVEATDWGQGREAVLGWLRRRGLDARRNADDETLLLPRSRHGREDFYALLRHYSFRLLLRDVLVHRESFSLADLQKYCSPDTARRYLAALRRARIVASRSRTRYTLARARVNSFGNTLEWLVATVLEREFQIPALWNVRVERLPGGGDWDVLACAEGKLIYVETKSSPPRHIDQKHVAAFFDRLEALRPDMAIFLEDTKLRMEDKLVKMFEMETARRLGPEPPAVERVEGEIFTIRNRVFLANTQPDLVRAIGTCLERFFASLPYCLSRGG